MREILFRGKRTDNGEWIYGDLMQNVDCIKIREQEKDVKHIAKSFEIELETVGQYTDLTDKNGKRIFEGDILGSRYDSLYPDDVAIEVVKWFRNGWYIQQENNLPDALCEYGVLPYSEVIGNVTDNPELLKEEAQP